MKKSLKKRKAAFEVEGSQQDKENQFNVGTTKKKRTRKHVAHGSPIHSPLRSQPLLVNRSTSAANAMAKIASINAQAAVQKNSGQQMQAAESEESEVQKVTYVCDSPAALDEDHARHPSVSTSSPRSQKEEETASARFSKGSIRRSSLCPSDMKANTELRISISDQMALEAERLHLEAKLEAEEVAKEIATSAEKDAAECRVQDLQSAIMQLTDQMREMQASKKLQQDQLQQHFSHTSIVQAELQQFKHTSDILRRQVDLLQRQVQTYKEENIDVEKQLQEQKQINRRLSQRLSGHFNAVDLPEEVDLDNSMDFKPCNKVLPRAQKPLGTGPEEIVPHTSVHSLALQCSALDPSSTAAKAELRRCTPAMRSSFDEESDDQSNWLRVPTVTPSKAHAPAIYNEPRNRARQQEYATLLEQQMMEQQEKKRKQSAADQAPATDYFPFGRPGSGAPVRDANSNVVTNITFCRSKRPVPIDHPAGPLYAQRSVSQEVYKRK